MKGVSMSGEVPPVLWFLFWVGLSVGVISFGFFMAIIIHRGNMILTRQMGDSEGAKAGREIGKKAGNFTGLVVSACIAGGIAWWRLRDGGPQWVVYLFAIVAVFWAILAIRYLVSALTTSEK
jgi:hypothetical protein